MQPHATQKLLRNAIGKSNPILHAAANSEAQK